MQRPQHEKDADSEQARVYREMSPADRLRQSLRLARQMRSLMDAGLRAEHPDWTDEQRRQCIAERILYARTG
jgi:hypothetical protein